jgi:hypothetical protein
MVYYLLSQHDDYYNYYAWPNCYHDISATALTSRQAIQYSRFLSTILLALQSTRDLVFGSPPYLYSHPPQVYTVNDSTLQSGEVSVIPMKLRRDCAYDAASRHWG